MIKRALVVLASALCLTSSAASQRPVPAFAPPGTPISLGLAGYAKVLCSAVFVSGRDPAEAFKNSGFFLLNEKDRPDVTWKVDRERTQVHLTLRGTVTRTAKYFGDHGVRTEGVNKVKEGSPHCVDAIVHGEIAMVVNTTSAGVQTHRGL